MNLKDSLGNRMKSFYEEIPKVKLIRRTPVIIRIDGKAFHTFTRGMKRPFDEILIQSMQETTKYLCENIQGCVLGYTQSNEITLVLVDYKNLDTSAWFDYEIQKMCSIAASMTTMAFNRIFNRIATQWLDNFYEEWNRSEKDEKYASVLVRAIEQGAMFVASCFNIPKEEVTNCIYWRQLDASRNSIQMVGQAHFSHKQLQKKSCNDIQDMLMLEKGINWNNYPTHQKRGTCVVRNKVIVDQNEITTTARLRDTTKGENEWIIDKEIPIFKGDGRDYIEELINF